MRMQMILAEAHSLFPLREFSCLILSWLSISTGLVVRSQLPISWRHTLPSVFAINIPTRIPINHCGTTSRIAFLLMAPTVFNDTAALYEGAGFQIVSLNLHGGTYLPFGTGDEPANVDP